MKRARSSSSCQNNYRLIQNPVSLIEDIKRLDPRVESGLARLMVGALLSSRTPPWTVC